VTVPMMEAASTSETSANFYQTTRRNKPEDSHLHTHRRENPTSNLIYGATIGPEEIYYFLYNLKQD
jgi:hypothetical protein